MRRTYNPELEYPLMFLENKHSTYLNNKKNLSRFEALKEYPCKKCQELDVHNLGIGKMKQILRYMGEEIYVCFEHVSFYKKPKKVFS